MVGKFLDRIKGKLGFLDLFKRQNIWKSWHLIEYQLDVLLIYLIQSYEVGTVLLAEDIIL